MSDIESEVLAHRYLYYCVGRPVISDHEYDGLEKRAVDALPSSSPIHSPGSDLESSYSPEVKSRAMGMLQSVHA